MKLSRKKTRHTSPAPRELVARVGLQVRQMGAQSVMTSQIVAARFGLHTTDLECLDLIYLRKQATVGELSAATGLTSGAMTALIDRLERAGYVERVADAEDRRRIWVRIKPASIEPIKAVYAPIQKQMFKLWSSYSARDLEVIADFLSRSRDLAVMCAAEIQREAPLFAPKRRPPRSSRRDQQQASPPAKRVAN